MISIQKGRRGDLLPRQLFWNELLPLGKCLSALKWKQLTDNFPSAFLWSQIEFKHLHSKKNGLRETKPRSSKQFCLTLRLFYGIVLWPLIPFPTFINWLRSRITNCSSFRIAWSDRYNLTLLVHNPNDHGMFNRRRCKCWHSRTYMFHGWVSCNNSQESNWAISFNKNVYSRRDSLLGRRRRHRLNDSIRGFAKLLTGTMSRDSEPFNANRVDQ